MSVKKKIGTVVNENLLTAVKVLAAREHKKLSQVIEEALIQYLQRQRGRSIVMQTQGALKAPPEVVQAILEEEEGVFGG